MSKRMFLPLGLVGLGILLVIFFNYVDDTFVSARERGGRACRYFCGRTNFGGQDCTADCSLVQSGEKDCYDFCSSGSGGANKGCMLICKSKIDPRYQECRNSFCSGIPKQAKGICGNACYDVWVGEKSCTDVCDDLSSASGKRQISEAQCNQLCAQFPEPE